MKFALRVMSLVLAIIMLSSAFVACGSSNEPVGTGEGGSSASGTEEVSFYKDLPQMNWEGAEYRILGRNYAENNFKNKLMFL